MACGSLDCSTALLQIHHLKDRSERKRRASVYVEENEDDNVIVSGGFCIEELLQVSFRMSNLLEIRCTSASLMTTMARARLLAHTHSLHSVPVHTRRILLPGLAPVPAGMKCS